MKTSKPFLPPLIAVKVLDQLRERIRYLHYSLRTEKTYVYWVRFYIRFHGRRHPAEMGGAEVRAFVSWLVSNRRVSASTHRQLRGRSRVARYKTCLSRHQPTLSRRATSWRNGTGTIAGDPAQRLLEPEQPRRRVPQNFLPVFLIR